MSAHPRTSAIMWLTTLPRCFRLRFSLTLVWDFRKIFGHGIQKKGPWRAMAQVGATKRPQWRPPCTNRTVCGVTPWELESASTTEAR